MEVMDSIEQAIARLIEIYDTSTELARNTLDNEDYPAYAGVVYPKLTVEVLQWEPIDRTEPFGYVDRAGRYSAVLSKPRIMERYLREQLGRLSANYPCRIEVGPSTIRIPPEYIRDAPSATEARRAGDVADVIPRPTLDEVHDAIIDGEWEAFNGEELPLFHFEPQRFDIACARIEHYTGIRVDHVQKYILFTNYAMHTTEFVHFAMSALAGAPEAGAEAGAEADPAATSRYTGLALPNGQLIDRDTAASLRDEGGADALDLGSRFQMPRYDLITEAGDGISIINIGVGPSNAKTITDCLAVLRPEAWVMIGHCAGLDARMRIGDLILGNAYQREDHILDKRIPLGNPIPAIPEVQKALEASVDEIYGDDNDLMRTGTVLSTDDRNWEWHTPRNLWEWLSGSTAVAVDMESSTLATNGYRYRIPYGTLLSVSDLPLHAVPKLPAQAQAFYSNSKEAHVMCAVRAMEYLAVDPERLRTRKLRRTLGELPFR